MIPRSNVLLIIWWVSSKGESIIVSLLEGLRVKGKTLVTSTFRLFAESLKGCVLQYDNRATCFAAFTWCVL